MDKAQELLLRVHYFRNGLEEYDYSYLAHDIKQLNEKVEYDFSKLQKDIERYLFSEGLIEETQENKGVE